MAEAESLGDSALVDAASAKPQALSCLTVPSFSEACGFIDSRYSCLVLKTHRRHLALSPKYLSKKRSGIKEHLSAELLKYNAVLEGVPVAYDNIKLVGELGDIYDDVGYIHINIEADFVIFQPKCGQRLVGVVNKKAPSHVGCLVHGCFNASVPRPIKMPVDAWQHMDVNLGDQLEFEVFRLDSDAVGVFCIRGKLDRQLEAEAIKKLNVMSEEQNSNVPSGEVQDIEIAVDETSILSENTTKKKGKKRLFEETVSQNACLENQQDPNLSLEEAPKKKRKKHKHQEALSVDQPLEVDGSGVNSALEDSVMDISTQSEYKIMNKKSKKKKHWESLTNSDNGVAVDDGVVELDSMSVVPSSQEHKTKKSKKKKHKINSDLESSLLNGMTEDSLVSGDGTLEELETELGATKKKHKKKNKNTSMDLDLALASSETPPDNVLIQQETRKIQKHKKRRQDPAEPGS
ncbi:DNA-directed RNA polymerase I subunit RPA43 [Bufo bufo]|uniref:DNA-directed RNA polymerase I subunit RPA43 n=1 Tax=Bufo bufo TaxID=8384 RepID=UPI001ABEE00F|nr:DNA-directed RNA polymerase I subunit RPA43 [Bufo bufo]